MRRGCRNGLALLLLLVSSVGCTLLVEPPRFGDAGLAGETGRKDRLDGLQELCGPTPGFRTVAFYPFETEETPLSDTSGNDHHGLWHPANPAPLTPGEQGLALRLNGNRGPGEPPCASQSTATSWAELPSGQHWQLAAGRISFWVRFDTDPTSLEAVLGRDRHRENLGDLTVFRLPGGQLAARLQSGRTGLDSGFAPEVWRCSAPNAAPAMRWVKVELRFGKDLVLCVDGAPGLHQGLVTGSGGQDVNCGDAPVVGGLAGIDRPWVLGSTNWCDDDLRKAPVLPMQGALDELRIEEQTTP
jgi:hypothetical protein